MEEKKEIEELKREIKMLKESVNFLRICVVLIALEKIIKALDLTVEEFFNFNSLEGDLNSKNTLNLKRLTMKLKQLPKQQQATFIRIFEDIIDNLD